MMSIEELRGTASKKGLHISNTVSKKLVIHTSKNGYLTFQEKLFIGPIEECENFLNKVGVE